MESYELTIVLPGKSTPAKVKSFEGKIKELTDSVKAKIKTSKNWGKKDLAYPIKKNNSGVYLYYELELETKKVMIISTKLNTDDDILRYLIVRKEKSTTA